MLQSLLTPSPNPSAIRRGDVRRRSAERRSIEVRRLSARDPIFSRNEPAARIHELAEGVVMIHRSLADGRRQIVDIVGPGRLFGFTAGHRHDCEALALTDVVVYSVDRSTTADDAHFADRVHRAMAEEIGRMRDLALLLGRKSALERVASFFLTLSDAARDLEFRQAALVLPVTRSEIADHLGLTIETVSRNITKLKQRGVIALERGDVIRVLDGQTLRDLAFGLEAAA